ncbi:MAG: recombinase XerD, partial [Mycobacterium sp.]|nr:recombinase XerD [Mycobacterium sp.]
MTAMLRLVRDDAGAGSDGGGFTPIEQWELYMRGAGRSERTISETIGLLHRLQRFADKPVEYVAPLDISRFLGRTRLKPASR